MTKERKLIKLINHYETPELLKSLLTGFLFFIFPSILTTILFVNIVVLYIQLLLYLMLVFYTIIILISFFSNKVLIETLINYKNKSLEISYRIIYLKLMILTFFIISFILGIGYLVYLSIN